MNKNLPKKWDDDITVFAWEEFKFELSALRVCINGGPNAMLAREEDKWRGVGRRTRA